MIPFYLPLCLPGHILFTKRWIDIVLISSIYYHNHLKSFINKATKSNAKLIYLPFYASPRIRTSLNSLLIPPFLKGPDNPFLFNAPHYWNSFLLVKSSSAFPGLFLTRFLFLIPYVQYGICPGKWPAVTNDSFI